jgi:hypothetical protein
MLRVLRSIHGTLFRSGQTLTYVRVQHYFFPSHLQGRARAIVAAVRSPIGRAQRFGLAYAACEALQPMQPMGVGGGSTNAHPDHREGVPATAPMDAEIIYDAAGSTKGRIFLCFVLWLL